VTPRQNAEEKGRGKGLEAVGRLERMKRDSGVCRRTKERKVEKVVVYLQLNKNRRKPKGYISVTLKVEMERHFFF